ncbi:S1 family peptidase [Methylobacterium bullatum]|uniref:Uncharacterized protein n=1 Tax=Methylobacterium bullatum TaxID=570505 RepID=A0A679K063_9HYPH|nr:hypothetical protein MBLL_00690 [Methylobacterium bullatum]
MMSVEAILARSNHKEVEAFYQIMWDYAHDRETYLKSLEILNDAYIWSANSRNMWTHGHFNLHVLETLVVSHPKCPGGLDVTLLRRILINAISYNLVIERGTSGDSTHWWDANRFAALDKVGVVKNILVNRPEQLVEAYRPAVLSIAVLKDKEEGVGTGLVLAYPTNEGLSSYIVTAKHVVDPKDGITIVEIQDGNGAVQAIDFDGWIHHPTMDISIKPLDHLLERNFRLSPFDAVLSEVITLGYPSVPTTSARYLLAHRGEINAIVASYLNKGKYILISNATSPGNSGGPVIDRTGLVVGMVTEAFEGNMPGGLIKMQAALSSWEVYQFLSEITGMHDWP